FRRSASDYCWCPETGEKTGKRRRMMGRRRFCFGIDDRAEQDFIIAYLKSPSLDTYLHNKHQLIGNILDLAGEIGIDFAFPTQTIHMVPPEKAAINMAAE
ncbi:MAG: hypothetical protein AAFW98_17100, partial [Pseudomonadota bacterium]